MNQPLLVVAVIASYFAVLLLTSYFTSKKADTLSFFTAHKQSPWYLIAFGMIGTSISGVTFVSVPGEVGRSAFSYFQVVLGYTVGYTIIALVLMPLYYKLNLVSIYTYLEKRFGFWSYKTGAFFFLLSRTIGASFRLFLAIAVLHMAVSSSWDISFTFSAFLFVALIWLYTFRGGIKTIVWTDTFLTFFLLSAVGLSIYLIADELNLSVSGLVETIRDSSYSKMFFFDDPKDSNYFFKQFFAGIFIAVVMTGLDQDMMQKNLTCRNIREAQKNMFWFTITLVVVNFFFLCLGALLYIYSAEKNIALPGRTDELYPTLAFQHFNTFTVIAFLTGITASTFSSADSALTSLTTSFCIDFMNFENRSEQEKKKRKFWVHIGMSLLLFGVIVVFNVLNNQSVITAVFKAAGYTYGPLLGMYAFGVFTKRQVADAWVPAVCIASPLLCWVINQNSQELFWGYKFGFEILILNGLLTFLGMLVFSRRADSIESTTGRSKYSKDVIEADTK